MNIFVPSKSQRVGEDKLQPHKSFKDCQLSFSRFLLVKVEVIGVKAEAEAVEK